MIAAPLNERVRPRRESFDDRMRADLARERGLADLRHPSMDTLIRAWGSARLGLSYTAPREHRLGARPSRDLPGSWSP